MRYTLLPRRPGMLTIPALTYLTYAPGGGYRTLAWSGATIEVTPGLTRDAAARAGRPRALVPTPRPGGAPWTAGRPYFALALLALGLALVAARHRPVAASDDGERSVRVADVSTALEKLAAAKQRGDAREFWRLAEEALDRLGADAAGDSIAELRSGIARARYAPGGGSADEVERGWEQIRRVVTAQRDALRREAAPRTSAVARTLAIAFAAPSIGPADSARGSLRASRKTRSQRAALRSPAH